jgi:hypothetical protein
VCRRAAHSISKFEARNQCAISEHVDDWEGPLDVFLENAGKKRGEPKTLAVLAMLAMLLFGRAQAQ